MGKFFLDQWILSTEEARIYCASLLDMPIEEVQSIMEYYMKFDDAESISSIFNDDSNLESI